VIIYTIDQILTSYRQNTCVANRGQTTADSDMVTNVSL